MSNEAEAVLILHSVGLHGNTWIFFLLFYLISMELGQYATSLILIP